MAHAKTWLLTWPLCGSITPAQAKEQLEFACAPAQVLEYVVAREPHQEDGKYHLHAFLKLNKEVRLGTHGEKFDLEDSTGLRFHGDYKVSSNPVGAAKYCSKGNDFITNVDLDSWSRKKGKLTNAVLLDTPLKELVDKDMVSIYNLPKLIEARAAYARLTFRPRTDSFPLNPWGLLLPFKLDKKRHYWFWSTRPNMGKTTFLEALAARAPCLWYSWAEKFQVSVPDAQFVLMDEYSVAHLTIMSLNQICDGHYHYPVKGDPGFTLTRPTVVACGNKSPYEIYSEPHHDLIKARFTVFEVNI